MILLALGLTAWAERRVIAGGLTYQTDARLHEYWMRRFQDPELFRDPLTEGLLQTGYIPHGFRALYWALSHVIDPVRAAELMPLVLVPLSAWLLFRIVRLHTAWRPAAWLGTVLFLLPLDIHRFSGGHQRAFYHPIVLLTVYLLLRRRAAFAALVPAAGALLYPPAALVGVGIMAISSLDRSRRGRLDLHRAAWAAGSAALVAVATLVPARVAGYSPEIFTRGEALELSDFGERGKVRFFNSSTLEYLSQNLSGLNLQWSGSLLVCAALVLLALRPRSALLLRREVWAMPVAALVLFGLAHAVLFRLYLPQRYTYALVPFCAILVAVAWRPTWERVAERRPRPWLLALAGAVAVLAVAFAALTVFPLGRRLPPGDAAELVRDRAWWFGGALVLGVALLLALAAGRRRPAWAAGSLLAATLLAGATAAAGSGYNDGVRCRNEPLLRYLGTLPADAVVAGDPVQLDCVPIVSERAVVINKKLFQVWEKTYWRMGRQRTFDSIRAMFGGDLDDVLLLRDRYSADYLVVDPQPRLAAWAGYWPFTPEVRRLARAVETPAAERLPAECLTWEGARLRVYDLACAEERAGGR